MTSQELLTMVIFSLVAVVVTAVGLNRYERYEKQRDNHLYIGRDRKYKVLRLHKGLKDHWLLGTYTRRISKRYEMLYPAMQMAVARKTVSSVLGILGINILLFVLLFLMRPTFLSFLSASAVVYVVQSSTLSVLLRRAEARMLGGLDLALSDIKHHYISTRHIGTALWLTVEQSQKELKGHMEEIYHILDRPDMEEAAREYNEGGKDRYFKLLLGICVKTAEQGDSENSHGESVFTENINILKRDVRREVEKMKKTGFIFSGLTFVATAPVLSLTAIRNWAVSSLTDLSRFYDGKSGFYIAVMGFLLTIVSFQLLERLRDPEGLYQKSYPLLGRISMIPPVRRIIGNRLKKGYGKRMKQQELLKRLGEGYTLPVFLLRQVIHGICGFILGGAVLFAAHGAQYDMLLADTAGLYEILPLKHQKSITQEELAGWMRESGRNGIQYITGRLEEAGVNGAAIQRMATMAQERLDVAHGLHVMWYEFLAVFLSAVLCYWYPVLMLQFKKLFLEDYMAEEVMCFQTILSMQIYLKGISLVEMLESMELFARVFRPSIQDCIHNMPRDERKALEALKEQERFPPFHRLVDCFLMSDGTDIPTAFDEVADDIRHFQDVYALEMEMILKRKKDAAELIAFIPGMFILIGYLILPFIAAGMTLFETSFQGNINDTTF